MNLLLTYKCHPEGASDPFTSLLPAGLLTLDAVARKAGHQVTLANLSAHSWRKVRELMKKLRPQVVGISQFTHNREESLALARLAKELDPRCFVVLGGPHATHSWQEILPAHPEVDAVVIGEGESTLVELLEILGEGGDLAQVAGIALLKDGKAVCGPPRAPIGDLDSLPLPGLETSLSYGVDYRRQLEFVITSRGCPASCLFCSSPLFWGRGVRFRSPASVVGELRMLKERYGLVYFSFRDDTFTADKRRVLEICRLMREQQLHLAWNCQSRVNAVDEEMLAAMKLAGCECIQFGVESGSPAMLKALGKRILPADVERAAAAVRKVGINLSVYLITGIPGEGEEDLRQTLRLIEKIKPQDGQVSPLVYYPGTRLFDDAVHERVVPSDLFERKEGEGFLVRKDPFVERSRETMLKTLLRTGRKGAYRAGDFDRQRALLGYCFVTEMLAGEALEQDDNWPGALALYKGMQRKEPKNPWGYLLAGGMQARMGEFFAARESYAKVLTLVPNHLPALVALGEIALAEGDAAAARRHFKQALKLEPSDESAREGLAAAGG
ncbi:B12-binding domain-containing radical SAM protein [Geomonas sp.]|uniref:B12-binding domain-containing radical SAM protein n=1 Tax=Geomonas sp. TaxID=2651584 RepID=UPI002B48B5D1|nr:radical SAM protein [Geomonas sp.]HJV35897.1 radical SAM protein [Geomonas sp.]